MKTMQSSSSGKTDSRAICLAALLVLLAACLPVTGMAQFVAADAYALVGYDQKAVDNPIARLAERLNSGDITLAYSEQRGYLDSLLEALDIDPSSQMLVFSPTSLQHKLISPKTPRALYFNDDTYIGYVQNSSIIEVTTIDDRQGVVFYTFDNRPMPKEYFERANQTCLVCHDTQGRMGGGVPMLMTLSSVYSERNVPLKNFSGVGNVVDQTPIEDRWGGWYVTGRHGLQTHLGNLILPGREQLDDLNDYRVWNLESLADIEGFDPEPYPAMTSDIVALMVLEHQVTVQNQLTYIKFKAPAVLGRRGFADVVDAKNWDALPAEPQRILTRMLERLVGQVFFKNADPLDDRLTGTPEYVADFQARGPRDDEGRSLRDFDLRERLFTYPLSYLVYTSDFQTLPAYGRDYVYRRIASILVNGEEEFAYLSAQERQDIHDILLVTHKQLQPYLEESAANPGAFSGQVAPQ